MVSLDEFKQATATKAAAGRKKTHGRTKQQAASVPPQSREEAAARRDEQRSRKKDKKKHREGRAGNDDDDDGEKKKKKKKKTQGDAVARSTEHEPKEETGRPRKEKARAEPVDEADRQAKKLKKRAGAPAGDRSADEDDTGDTDTTEITAEEVETADGANGANGTAVRAGVAGRPWSNARKRATDMRKLQKATASLGYYSASGFGKHSALHSRAGLDGARLIKWGLVKRMLRHTHGYATGGHTSEGSQAKSYRQKAMQHPYTEGAKRVLATQSSELLRRIVNQCVMVAAEGGRSRVTCGSVSAALRPLSDALDLRVDVPPNSLVAQARIDGALPTDGDPARRAAQDVDVANYKRSVHGLHAVSAPE